MRLVVCGMRVMMIARGAGRRQLHARAAIFCVLCCACSAGLPPPRGTHPGQHLVFACSIQLRASARLPRPHAGGTTPPAAKKCRIRSWRISRMCSKRSWPMWSGLLRVRAARAAHGEAQRRALVKAACALPPSPHLNCMHSGRVGADTLGVLQHQGPASIASSEFRPSDSSERNDDMYAVSQTTEFPEP